MTRNVAAPQYKYTPLPDNGSIRVLRRLGRSTQDGLLHFSLSARDLTDPSLRYHCLSYTWGNPFAHGVRFDTHYASVDAQYAASSRVPVVVDGQVLHIQRNLHDALDTLPQDAYAEYARQPTRMGGGQTVVHGAAERGREAMLRLYAARAVDLDVVDDQGRTPLHVAAEKGEDACVDVLCASGATRGLKDRDGMTALDLAEMRGCKAVVERLRAWEGHADPVPRSIPEATDGPADLIWVDAVCINQEDVGEKSVQVSMMDRIYSRASYVVAWLGPEDGHTEAGIRALYKVSRHLEAFRVSRIQPYHGDDRASYNEAGVPLIPSDEWDGLASIYQRQWFRRAWIVQEAVLPDVLIAYCGRRLLSCHDLGSVAEAIRLNEARLGTSGSRGYTPANEVAVSVEWNMAEMFKWREKMYWTNRADTEQQRQAYRDEFTLERLVADFWTFRATEPRDKIFSLDGLLNAFSNKRSSADYGRSVASVYTGAARKIIRETGSLGILTHWSSTSLSAGDLPSWVPDFRAQGLNPMPEYNADGGAAFDCAQMDEGDSPHLVVQGFRVGEIGRAGGRVSTKPGGKWMFDPTWLDLALSLAGAKGGSQEERPALTEVLWRTLCMNTPAGGFFNSALLGKEAPAEMGRQFSILMLLMILAGADQKMLESVGLEAGAERERHTIIHSPAADPWRDLEPTLLALDELEDHDGERCLTPSRDEVAAFWEGVKYTVVRTTAGRLDEGGVDFTVPANVMDGTDRLVGRGMVSPESIFYQRCREFGAAYAQAIGGRQLVTVDGAYLGLASTSAGVGDEVWILRGLRAPAVLRPVTAAAGSGTGPQMYQFVGCAYVHGIMNGEAVPEDATMFGDVVLG